MQDRISVMKVDIMNRKQWTIVPWHSSRNRGPGKICMKKDTMATLVRMIAGMYHTWVTQVYCENQPILIYIYLVCQAHLGRVGDLRRCQRPHIPSHTRAHH